MTQPVRLSCRQTSQRRASGLSERRSEDKLAEIRNMSAAQRLALAFQLSDTCYELQRACSSKR
ncbi:MAG: hypothetical protein NTNFB02_36150 [Nitrospira sp.]